MKLLSRARGIAMGLVRAARWRMRAWLWPDRYAVAEASSMEELRAIWEATRPPWSMVTGRAIPERIFVPGDTIEVNLGPTTVLPSGHEIPVTGPGLRSFHMLFYMVKPQSERRKETAS